MTAATGTSGTEVTAVGSDVTAGSAARGVVWQSASYLLGKAFFLVFTVVLARLLSPQQIGLVALAQLLVTYLEVVADLGVGHGLVFHGRSRRRTDQAFALSLLNSAVLGGLIFTAAPAVAAFFDEDALVPLVRILALAFVAGGLAQVPDGILRRDLRFSRRLLTELARTIGQGVVSVALALAGFGAASIAWGYVAGQVARAATGWVLAGHRPGRGWWRLDGEETRRLVAFGSAASGASLLLTLVHDVDYLIVGRTLGATAAGYYSIAFRIPQTAVVSLYWAVASVTFPVFSRIRTDARRVRRAYLSWVRLQALYGMPAGALVAVTAPALIHTLLGPRWAPATPALQALGWYAAVRSLSSGGFDVLKGVGRPRLALAIAGGALAVVVPVLLVASTGGIAAVGWAQVGLSAGLGLVMQAVCTRVVGVRRTEVVRAAAPGVVAAIAVAVAAGGVVTAIPGAPFVELLLAPPVALLAAAAAVRVVAPGALLDVARTILRRDDPPPPSDEFVRLGRLFLPGGTGAVVSDVPADVVAADVRDGAPLATVAGRLPRSSMRPLRRLVTAALLEQPSWRMSRRRGARVQRLEPPSWRGGRRDLLRRPLLAGAVVDLHPSAGPRLVDEVAAAAGFVVEGARLRAAGDGSLLAIGTTTDGRSTVLRVGLTGESGDPVAGIAALDRLRSEGVALIPEVVAHGRVGPASWSLESTLVGGRPTTLAHALLDQVADWAAGLPVAPTAPTSFVADIATLVDGGVEVDAAAVERTTGVIAGLPAVVLHGDLWAGNLLVEDGVLRGVVDWEHWHPAGVPGVDLLHLVAAERRVIRGDTLDDLLRAKPWTEPAAAAAVRRYFETIGVARSEEVLDAVAFAWWAHTAARELRRRRAPAAAVDGVTGAAPLPASS